MLLGESKVAELCAWTGRDFDMDLMATPVSAPRLPGRDVSLFFYPRFQTNGCAGVDVLDQDLRRMPGLAEECFGYAFPPTALVGVALQRLAGCQARAVLVVPELSWYLMLAEAAVRTFSLAGKGAERVFFRMNHHRGKSSFAFRRWAMKAVQFGFRPNG